MGVCSIIIWYTIIANIIVALFFLFWRFFYFFRNPMRRAPQEEGIVVAPADGYIIYIKEVKNGLLPISAKGKTQIPLTEFADFNLMNDADYYLVGIYMSIIDVHFNRSPIDGKIIFQKYCPSLDNRSMLSVLLNLILKKEPLEQNGEYLVRNSRNLLWIEGGKIAVGVIQIADKWISKIESYVEPGQGIKQGDLIGLIRMGSQVDILLPKTVKLTCRIRQKVKAGESIIGRIMKDLPPIHHSHP